MRLRRILLTVCLLCFAGCTDPPPPPDVSGNDNDPRASARFAGADTCRACHAPDHADWVGTAHARAFDALAEVEQDQRDDCLPCHTVGFGQPGGFVDFATAEHLAGVQCESCHGPAQEHALDPLDRDLLPIVTTNPAACGVCHTDFHHPTFDEWRQSRHARALDAVRAEGRGVDECLRCHSGDYRLALEQDGSDLPTIDTARFGVICTTCHAPHGGTAEPAQLSLPLAALCVECHTQRDAPFGDEPHNPQFDLLTGTGGRGADGAPLVIEHAHTNVVTSDAERSCARCHVVALPVEDPNQADPDATVHTFNPFDTAIEGSADAQRVYAGCLPCHTAEEARTLRRSTQASIEARLDALAPFFLSGDPRYIDPDSLDTDEARATLESARFNFRFVETDGSLGVHNPSYAGQLLTIAETIVAELRP